MTTLPANILVTYYWPWGNHPSIAALQPQKYNMLTYVRAYGDGGGGGTMIMNGIDASLTNGELTTWKESGRIALLMVSAMNNFYLQNKAQEDQFVNSVFDLCDQYGFDGIDIDFKDSFSVTTSPNIQNAVDRFKARGDFIVSVLPRYSEVRDQAGWGQCINGMIRNIDFISLQEYDNYAYFDPDQIQIRADYANLVVNYPSWPMSKLVLGTCAPGAENYGGDGYSATVYTNALQYLRATYPGFRGASVWHSQGDESPNDATAAWQFANCLGGELAL